VTNFQKHFFERRNGHAIALDLQRRQLEVKNLEEHLELV